MIPKNDSKDSWVKKLKKYIPEFLKQHEILNNFYEKASLILHGSLTLGFDDSFSDIDLWLLIPKEELIQLEKISGTLFFEIDVNDKPGHLNAESIEEFSRRFYHLRNSNDQPDMDIVFQMRNAAIILDKNGIGKDLITSACQPMRQEVSDGFFFYHYIEMRGEHRASDNPMERNDPMGVLLSVPKTLAQALRAAMVLDNEPYPYNKWLYYTAKKTPTGKKLIPSLEKILKLIAEGGLHFQGPEAENPISLEIREIRKILIKEARTRGNNSPWLEKWWLYMTQARDIIQKIHW